MQIRDVSTIVQGPINMCRNAFYFATEVKLLSSTLSFADLRKVSFFGLSSKMQIIPIKKINIKAIFIQFIWFFRLKC